MLINRNGDVQCNAVEYGNSDLIIHIDIIFSDPLNRSTIEMKYYGKCINYEKMLMCKTMIIIF